MILSHDPAILGACLVITITAAVTDWRTRTIPNLITFGGLAFGIVSHAAIGFVEGGVSAGLRGILVALAGALLCGILPFFSFVRGQMGGGDVKLFAAIGAMVGPALGWETQAATFIVAALIIAPFMAIRSGIFRSKIQQIRAKLRGESMVMPELKAPRIVLAPAILVGLCVAFLRHGVLIWS